MLKRTLITLAIAATTIGSGMAIPTGIDSPDHPNLDPAIKTSPAGTEIVANLTSSKFKVTNGGGYSVDGFGFLSPEEISPDLTWSKAMGIGEAYGPIIRSNQWITPGPHAFYEPETIQLSTPVPIVGMWMHDDAFFNVNSGVGGSSSPFSSGLPYPAVGFTFNGGSSITDSIGPVDGYGNAFVSFSAPVENIYMRGPYDAGFSILGLVGEGSITSPIVSAHVPDGGNTLLLLTAGLLGLIGVNMLCQSKSFSHRLT